MAFSSSMKSAQQPFCPSCETSKLTESRCPTCDQFFCNVFITRHSHNFKQVPCHDHEGYFYTNICIKCDKFVCPMCLSKTHQRHNVEVIDIYCNKIVEKLEENHKILVNNKLPEISQNIDDLKSLKRFHKASIDEEKKKISDEKEEYMKIIESHYDNLSKELEEKSNEIIKSISEDIKEQEQKLIDLKRKIAMADDTQLNGDILQICQNTKQLSEYVETCDTKIILFHLNIVTFLPQKYLLSSMGALTSSKLHIEKFLKQEIKESYDIEGFVCPESSIDASTDGTIWVTNNENLTQIQNFRTKITSHHKKIVDIAVTKDNDLLIIFENDNRIQIFKQNDSCITSFYSMPDNKFGIGMDVCSDGKIFVLCYKKQWYPLFSSNKFCVVVLSQNGKIKADVNVELYLSSRSCGRFRIKFPPSGIIYIADCTRNFMYCFDKDGYQRDSVFVTHHSFDFFTKEIFAKKWPRVYSFSSECFPMKVPMVEVLSFLMKFDVNIKPVIKFKLKDVNDGIINMCYRNRNEVIVLTLKRIYIVKLSKPSFKWRKKRITKASNT